MDIKKRDFLAVGMGLGLAATEAMAQANLAALDVVGQAADDG